MIMESYNINESVILKSEINYDQKSDIFEIKYFVNDEELFCLDNYSSIISESINDIKKGTINNKNLEYLISEIKKAFSI
ncbi:MAG: hypothetical protein VW079_01265 [Candidatus Woesearchaeota archaeon]